MRALASALAFARATGRVRVVVWERDAHCTARFDALFALREDLVVSALGLAPGGLADAARADPAWNRWAVLDYKAPGGKDAPVAASPDRNVYFRSAYALRADPPAAATWAAANRELRALVPASAVAALASAAGAPTMIGAHVRAAPVTGEVAGARIGANATAMLWYWRAKSAAPAFAAEMARIRAQEPGPQLLVAADSTSTRDALRRVPGATVLPGCDGRAEYCVQRALAEMLALARTRRLLTSPWSSFSEVTARIGGLSMNVAGVDFDADNVEDARKKYGSNVADVLQEVLRRRDVKRMRMAAT